MVLDGLGWSQMVLDGLRWSQIFLDVGLRWFILITIQWFKTPKPISGRIGLDLRVFGGIEHLMVLISCTCLAHITSENIDFVAGC